MGRISKEVINLKMDADNNKTYIQELQQMLDGDMSVEQWRNTGRFMCVEFVPTYINTDHITEDWVFTYAGGVVLELCKDGTIKHPLYSSKNLEEVEEKVFNKIKTEL